MPFAIYITLWNWLQRLGGLGLILLGVLDNSVIPVPGSMDALTVILAAHEKDWWPYYAAMAVIGAVFGGYLTYVLGRKGGKQALEKKLPREKAEKVYRTFGRYGFWSLFVPALLPPPVPFSPFLVAAGAMKYSRKRFFIAVGAGRTIRYGALAYLGSMYNKQIFGFFHKYYQPILWTFLTLTLAGGIVGAFFIWKRKRQRKALIPGNANQSPKAA